MAQVSEICQACGRPLKKKIWLVLPVLIGAAVGLGVGAVFVVYWFGVHAGFFHSMALIHEAAGISLGILAGLIIGALRRAS